MAQAKCEICGASNDMQIAELCKGICMGGGGYRKERSMEVNINNMDDLDNQNPRANMAQADEKFKFKIMPDNLVSDEIKQVWQEFRRTTDLRDYDVHEIVSLFAEFYHQSRLDTLAEQVEGEIKAAKITTEIIDHEKEGYPEGYIDGLKQVLNLSNNLTEQE